MLAHTSSGVLIIVCVDMLLGFTVFSISESGINGKDAQHTYEVFTPFAFNTRSVSYTSRLSSLPLHVVSLSIQIRIWSFHLAPPMVLFPSCSADSSQHFLTCLGSTFSIELRCPGRVKIEPVRHLL
jgi:hypothetical protein